MQQSDREVSALQDLLDDLVYLLAANRLGDSLLVEGELPPDPQRALPLGLDWRVTVLAVLVALVASVLLEGGLS